MSTSSGSSSDDANKRLVAQYTEIATLAGALAHEIKNPLSTIVLNMELLAEDFADAESPREKRAQSRISLVRRECQRLQTLLNDFLGFAKVRQLALEPSDLGAQVQRIVEFFRPTAKESNIEIICYLDPDLPSVVLDREAFQGALMNLVINAQQAMPDGGQLVFRTRPAAAGVALELIDTGIGMDEKALSRIFEAFYSTKPGGTGLGLATARKIVEAHGGRILAQSEPGRGTQFKIELPVLPRLASPTATTGS